MTTDDALDPRVVSEVHEQESPNEEANENIEESGETPDKPEDMDCEMEGETLPQQRHRVQVEERNAQKHKRTCSRKDG